MARESGMKYMVRRKGMERKESDDDEGDGGVVRCLGGGGGSGGGGGGGGGGGEAARALSALVWPRPLLSSGTRHYCTVGAPCECRHQ